MFPIMTAASKASPSLQAPRTLRVFEAAFRLRRSQATIYNWLVQGRFPNASQPAGWDWEIPISDVEAIEAEGVKNAQRKLAQRKKRLAKNKAARNAPRRTDAASPD